MTQANNVFELQIYKQQVEETERKARTLNPLQSGGGSGTGGGMEACVAKLESDVEHIKEDIAEIKTDIRDIKKDVNSIKEAMAEMRGSNEALAAEMRGLYNTIIAELNNKVSWKGLFTAALAIIAAIPTILLIAPLIAKLLQ